MFRKPVYPDQIRFLIGLAVASVIVALVLIGCSDTIGPVRNPFSLTVTVLDPSLGPIAGLRIGRINYLEGCEPFIQENRSVVVRGYRGVTGTENRSSDIHMYRGLVPFDELSHAPSDEQKSESFGGLQPEPIDTLYQNFPNPTCGTTAIRFSVAQECHGILELVNRRGEPVRTLIDRLMQAGAYIIIWDLLDSVGEQVIDGIYTYRLTLHGQTTSDILYMDSLYCTINCRYDERTWDIGSTDMDGVFKTNSIDFFPGLIDQEPQPCIDPTNQPYGKCYFTSEVTIVIRTVPPPEDSGWIYVMYRDVRLINGPNSFTYQWAPDDSIFITR